MDAQAIVLWVNKRWSFNEKTLRIMAVWRCLHQIKECRWNRSATITRHQHDASSTVFRSICSGNIDAIEPEIASLKCIFLIADDISLIIAGVELSGNWWNNQFTNRQGSAFAVSMQVHRQPHRSTNQTTNRGKVLHQFQMQMNSKHVEMIASRLATVPKGCSYYTKAIQLNKSEPVYYTNRALCYLKQKKSPTASWYFFESIKLYWWLCACI